MTACTLVGVLLPLTVSSGCGESTSPSQTADPPAVAVETGDPVDGPAVTGAGSQAAPALDADTTVVEPQPDPGPEAQADPLRGEVSPGDSLSRLVRRAGFDAATVLKLAEALTPITDPAALRLGQAYRFELDEAGQLSRFSLSLSATKTAVVEPAENRSTFRARVDEAATETRTVDLGVRVEGSLWAAMERAGIEPSLIDRVVDVFAYDVNFYTETRPGDTIKVVVERVELDGELVEWGRVVAAQYAGALGTHRAYLWEPKKDEARYVDDDGNGVSRTLLKTPLRFARVSSAFNPKRMHPVLHRVKGHNGVDYAAPTGTPIMAAADGRIAVRGDRGGAGNMVVLTHGNGMKTLYMHMSRFATGQKVGDKVKAKQVIGYVGATGLATGPHLHFGLTINGRYLDPQKIKQTRGPGVARSERQRWNTERTRLRARLDRVVAGAVTEDVPESGIEVLDSATGEERVTIDGTQAGDTG